MHLSHEAPPAPDLLLLRAENEPDLYDAILAMPVDGEDAAVLCVVAATKPSARNLGGHDAIMRHLDESLRADMTKRAFIEEALSKFNGVWMQAPEREWVSVPLNTRRASALRELGYVQQPLAAGEPGFRWVRRL